MATQDSSTTAARRIRLGMVGGGRDAFIGGVHRIASRIDDRYELVAGALLLDAGKIEGVGCRSRRRARPRLWRLSRDGETRGAAEDGIEAVAIVTPNHMHYPVAREFLKRGIHVICDKPLTSTLADAKKLAKAAETSGALFVLTHNYTGYPMIRQAREMVQGASSADPRGAGGIRRRTGCRRTSRRPARSRRLAHRSGALRRWAARPATSAPMPSTSQASSRPELAEALRRSRQFRRRPPLDDNGHVLMRFAGGAKGMLWCSQVAPGNENA
jgi:predicted dehydrogenase